MKYILTSISLLLVYCFPTIAHQADFYGKCTKIALPSCIASWNALTSNDTALYIVGDNGIGFIIYHNGGAKTIYTGTTEKLTGIQFLDRHNGFIWGAQGSLLKTNDGGITWDSINNITSDTIKKIQFIDINHGYAMTDSTLLKTADGGINWLPITLPIPINDFHFFDNQEGVFCGGNTNSGTLYKTINAGSNWTNIYTDTLNFKQLFYTNDTTYIYGNGIKNNVLLKSGNNGTTWSTVRNQVLWELKSSVNKFKNKTIFASKELNDTYIYGTPNYGTSTGSTDKIIDIYPLTLYGSERLYLLSEHGLYCYMNGGVLYYNSDFATDVKANPSNPNNTLGAGKTVRFKITVLNEFSSNLINLKGKLKCYSPYITVTDSLGDFGNVMSHDIATNTDEFEITLSNTIPDNYLSTFELVLGDPTQPVGTWNSIFSIPIVLSPFGISNTIVDDDNSNNSQGNNNNTSEPGETTELTVFSDNVTAHEFIDIEGKLVCFQSKIRIWEDTNSTSGMVHNHYRLGNFTAFAQNIQPTGMYVFNNNFEDTLSIPFTLIFTGYLNTFKPDTGVCSFNEYNNILYNWESKFKVNDGYPDPLAIPKSELNQSFIIYPNPNTGVFSIKATNNNLKNTTINIYNLQGKNIYNSVFSTQGQHAIDIATQPKGVYLLKINSGNYEENVKLVVN